MSSFVSVLITENQREELLTPSVYPNPVLQKLVVKIPSDFLPNAKVRLFDLNGIQYLKWEDVSNDSVLDVHSIPSGTYLLQIVGSNESTTKTIKIVKE